METFWGYYNPPDPKVRDVSPLLADSFDALAPAYVQIAGMDPLRDEGIAYVEKLKSAGYVLDVTTLRGPFANALTSVPVKLDLYPGLPHAFGYFPELPQAAKNARDLLAGIESLLA